MASFFQAAAANTAAAFLALKIKGVFPLPLQQSVLKTEDLLLPPVQLRLLHQLSCADEWLLC
jgi:hypothetical protein